MTAFGILWFILICVLMTIYFALDGFDLGVGVLFPSMCKNEKEKSIMLKSVGPIWDGNEVWLLTAGGALFAAFAPAYATSFSGFYLAIMLVLFGLIMRAVSFDFRAHAENIKSFWGALIVIGSFLPALLFGVAIGNILIGLPLNENGDYTGSFFALLNPFALLCGVWGLIHMLLQGSCWTAVKAPLGSELRAKACDNRIRFAVADMLVFVLVTFLYFTGVLPFASYEIGCLPLALLFALVFFGSDLAILFIGADKVKLDVLGIVLAGLACAGMVGLLGAALFPNFIPAVDPALSINIANAQGSDTTLGVMTIIACIGVPIVLVYHILVYRAFRGRIK